MKLIIMFLVLVFSMDSNATVLNYNESIHGDISYSGNAATSKSFGYFDIGTNIVTGSLNVTFSSFGGDSIDAFRFNIANGQELTSMTLLLEHSNNIKTIGIALLDMNPFSTIVRHYIDSTTNSPLSVFNSALPLGEDEYYLVYPSLVVGTGGPVNIDYTWKFEVSAIPEPSVILLLGCGVIGFLGSVKRKFKSG